MCLPIVANIIKVGQLPYFFFPFFEDATNARCQVVPHAGVSSLLALAPPPHLLWRCIFAFLLAFHAFFPGGLCFSPLLVSAFLPPHCTNEQRISFLSFSGLLAQNPWFRNPRRREQANMTRNESTPPQQEQRGERRRLGASSTTLGGGTTRGQPIKSRLSVGKS
jgi:hypothetical protein